MSFMVTFLFLSPYLFYREVPTEVNDSIIFVFYFPIQFLGRLSPMLKVIQTHRKIILWILIIK